jgi:hypothetical protein
VSANGAGLPTSYFVDLMFRMPATSSSSTGAIAPIQFVSNARTEAAIILTMSALSGTVSAADRGYLAQLVSARIGRLPADAQQHVDNVIAQIDQANAKAKETADKARKAGITTSLLMVLSLIIGAFIASAAAALGGHLRDEV